MNFDEPILVDMDGVLVHKQPLHIERLNQHFGTRYTEHDVTSFGYLEAGFTEEEAGFLWDLWHEPDCYDDVPPSPGALEGLDALRDMGHRIVVVSSPLLGSIESKYRWLSDVAGLERDDIILTKDKSMVRGRLLIDDAVHNLKEFPNASLCFHRPYNMDWMGPRVLSWELVPDTVNQLLSTGRYVVGEDS